MKYEIRTMLTVAKELDELKLDGFPSPAFIPKFDLVAVPDDAIGVTVKEEVITMVPVGTPKPFPGTEAAFLRKYTKVVAHITYLVPIAKEGL